MLSHPSKDWKALKGHVDAEIIRENAFGPVEGCVALLCGPPGIIQKAAVPALKEWGFREGVDLFGLEGGWRGEVGVEIGV